MNLLVPRSQLTGNPIHLWCEEDWWPGKRSEVACAGVELNGGVCASADHAATTVAIARISTQTASTRFRDVLMLDVSLARHGVDRRVRPVPIPAADQVVVSVCGPVERVVTSVVGGVMEPAFIREVTQIEVVVQWPIDAVVGPVVPSGDRNVTSR